MVVLPMQVPVHNTGLRWDVAAFSWNLENYPSLSTLREAQLLWTSLGGCETMFKSQPPAAKQVAQKLGLEASFATDSDSHPTPGPNTHPLASSPGGQGLGMAVPHFIVCDTGAGSFSWDRGIPIHVL